MHDQNSPIGIFDSGIGGLTVAKEILQLLPHEDIVYLGDTEHLPYGSKSETAVQHFALANSGFLIAQDAKIIVIACNTASAVALDHVRHHINLPVVGVVESGAFSAVNSSKSGRIGIIGTKTTIRSGAYTKAINEIDPTSKVIEIATPLLVHLVEENWIEHKVTLDILQEYLAPLLNENIDTLVLGCTHYPFITEQIKQIAPNLTLVDSATAAASSVATLLAEKQISTTQHNAATITINLTDIYADTETLASSFLGQPVTTKLVEVK